MTTIILNIQWNSVISEYDLAHVEINKSKVDLLVEYFLRRDVSFIRIDNTRYPSYLKASN